MHTIHIQYVTETGGIVSMHHISYHADRMTWVKIGRDVRNLSVIVESSPFLSSPPQKFHYDLRVDRLILLNLATQLLQS